MISLMSRLTSVGHQSQMRTEAILRALILLVRVSVPYNGHLTEILHFDGL